MLVFFTVDLRRIVLARFRGLAHRAADQETAFVGIGAATTRNERGRAIRKASDLAATMAPDEPCSAFGAGSVGPISPAVNAMVAVTIRCAGEQYNAPDRLLPAPGRARQQLAPGRSSNCRSKPSRLRAGRRRNHHTYRPRDMCRQHWQQPAHRIDSAACCQPPMRPAPSGRETIRCRENPERRCRSAR